MPDTQIQLAVTLTEVDCGECGGTYALNERYHRQCREKGKSWTCPYCKTGWGFSGNGELQLEQKRHKETRARLNEAAAAKAELENKLSRVQRGVCPDCNRSFKNLLRHMACKHGKK